MLKGGEGGGWGLGCCFVGLIFFFFRCVLFGWVGLFFFSGRQWTASGCRVFVVVFFFEVRFLNC